VSAGPEDEHAFSDCSDRRILGGERPGRWCGSARAARQASTARSRPGGHSRPPLHPRTEDAYVHWIKRYIFFYKLRHPAEMGPEEISGFLTHLAVDERLSASTQNQACNALLFLYKAVLGKDVGQLREVVRADRPRRLPVVLTHEEVGRLLEQLDGVVLLVCRLLYGSGLRLLEALCMRVKDVDFQRLEIVVRDGKGGKDRVTMLPATCRREVIDHLERVRRRHREDLGRGLGRAPLPDALARKYGNADREWGWQYVFPASSHYTDRRTGVRHRHHLHETVIQKAVSQAARRAGIAKLATPHTLRHYPECGIIPRR
jgi:integron integrase